MNWELAYALFLDGFLLCSTSSCDTGLRHRNTRKCDWPLFVSPFSRVYHANDLKFSQWLLKCMLLMPEFGICHIYHSGDLGEKYKNNSFEIVVVA